MKKVIGEVGVDSGQILVCDPCYIDSQWEHEKFNSVRRYRHTDGTIIQHVFNGCIRLNTVEITFNKFDDIIPKYNKCMNDMLEQKEVIELPDDVPAENPFSYNACCKKTLGDDKDGQLNYKLGHAGVGVVSNTGFGDGVYPVYADIDDRTRRVKSITIVFIGDDEDDEEEINYREN